MLIRDNSFGQDLHEKLAHQADEALDRRLEPADAVEFIKWVTETLRKHRQTYNDLATEHSKLNEAADSAIIGLKRLEALVKYFDRNELEYLQGLHRTFIHRNRGIGYMVSRCKKVLDETTMNYQLAAETLKQPLADRHKKIGVQKELGLRLRDIDADYERCKNAVGTQKKLHQQLADGIQKLMHSASIKLPPALKEQASKEDQIKQIALAHKKTLEKGVDNINPSKLEPLPVTPSFGEEPEVVNIPASPASPVSSKKHCVLLGASLIGGVALSLYLFGR